MREPKQGDSRCGYPRDCYPIRRPLGCPVCAATDHEKRTTPLGVDVLICPELEVGAIVVHAPRRLL